jgi:hypothetical protein
MEVVLDPGSIPYAQITLFRDADLSTAWHYGVEPGATTYRLIEIPLRAIVTPNRRYFPSAVQERCSTPSTPAFNFLRWPCFAAQTAVVGDHSMASTAPTATYTATSPTRAYELLAT